MGDWFLGAQEHERRAVIFNDYKTEGLRLHLEHRVQASNYAQINKQVTPREIKLIVMSPAEIKSFSLQ